VGVNINSSPQSGAPFPPTYYPGVTNRASAEIVHVNQGDVRELELRLPEVAKPRNVRFTAVGLDGSPLREIYIQLEDLRFPGYASSHENVDLDERGEGSLTIYAGYSYHLHASHWVSYGNDWCSKPVVVPSGTEPLSIQFVMDHSETNCDLAEIDGSGK
jgi:hypothetical protein